MKKLMRNVWHETRGAFDRLPVWLPGTRMSLGDVGTFDDNGWVRHTDLDALGIPAKSEPVGPLVDYNYVSRDGAEVSTWLAATADPAASGIAAGNAGLRVRFSRAGAFLLKADRVGVRRIVDLVGVDRRILAAYHRKAWRPDWVVVSEVARAGSLLMIVSAGTGGEAFVDLGADAPLAGLPVASVDGGVRLGTTRGLAASFAGSSNAAVLWRGRCVRDPWWASEPTVGDTRGRDLPDLVPDGYPDDAGPEVIDVELPMDLPRTD